MNDEKKYTEREVILCQQAAFEEGCRAVFRHEEGVTSWQGSRTLARKRFPLPKMTRPRVVHDHNDRCDYRAMNGTIERRDEWQDWRLVNDTPPTARRVKLWADLLANPTEEVEETA